MTNKNQMRFSDVNGPRQSARLRIIAVCVAMLAIYPTGALVYAAAPAPVVADNNPSITIAELRRIAESGDPLAQWALGERYRDGGGVEKSETEAAKWLLRAAEQGLTAAQHEMMRFFKLGLGVPKSDRVAAYWARRAAEGGDLVAMGAMGQILIQGEGVSKDSVEAMAWWYLAAESGDPKAEERKAWLEPQLGKQSIEAARRRSNILSAQRQL